MKISSFSEATQLMARETRRVTRVVRRAVQCFGFGETRRKNQRYTQNDSE